MVTRWSVVLMLALTLCLTREMNALKTRQIVFDTNSPKPDRPFEHAWSEKFAEVLRGLNGGEPATNTSRIVNGALVSSDANHPEIVGLLVRDNYNAQTFCTGVVIDSQIIMTAAHCVATLPEHAEFWVCAGTSDLGRFQGFCSRAERAIIPAAYDPNVIVQSRDIALVRLEESILRGRVRRMTLDNTAPKDNTRAVAVGFGRFSSSSNSDGRMREVDTNIVANIRCRTLQHANRTRDKNMLCSDGNFDGTGGTACRGDSGGPLVVTHDVSGKRYCVGVASFVRFRNEECSSEFENVYMSMFTKSHYTFIISAAAQLGGTALFKNQDKCNPETISQCLSHQPISCLSERKPSKSCCTESARTLRCLESAFDECQLSPTLADLQKYFALQSQFCSADAFNCFPGSAKVELEGGQVKEMSELVAGDSVLSEPGIYTRIIGFTHRLQKERGNFVRITAGGRRITLTGGHYLPVGGRLFSADAVAVGDQLTLSDGAVEEVTLIEHVEDTGLFNPQTLSGKIAVDGIVASTFTTAVHPTLAHLLLALPRLMFRLGMRDPMGSFLYGDAPEILRTISIPGRSIL